MMQIDRLLLSSADEATRTAGVGYQFRSPPAPVMAVISAAAVEVGSTSRLLLISQLPSNALGC